MAQVLSESVALATKCCAPDAPPRPKALEERVKSIEGRAEWQLKLTWAKPDSNGHPIQQYCLQQSERLTQGTAGGGAASAPSGQLFDGRCEHDARPDEQRWSEWRSVYINLLPEVSVRRLLLSQLLPMCARDFRVSAQAHMRPPQRGTTELRFRVSAINSLGSSLWSEPIQVSAARYSCFFHGGGGRGSRKGGKATPLLPKEAIIPEPLISAPLPTPLPRARQKLIQGANLQQQSQLEAEAESIRAQLDYPMALDVVMGFLVESRSVSRPRSPYVMGTSGGRGPGAAGMGTVPPAPLRPLVPDSTAEPRQ